MTEFAKRVVSLLEATGNPKCLEIAAWVRRTGRTTHKIIAIAAREVKVCGLCGKKALYRYGIEGRCSVHKMVRTAGKDWNLANLNAVSADVSTRREEFDRADKKRRALKGMGKYAGLVLEKGSR